MSQSLIIVADQVFVVAERINHIYIEEREDSDYIEIRAKGILGFFGKKQRAKAVRTYYDIRLNYVQVNSQRGEASMEVTLLDKEEAYGLFATLVKQYRDQNPDHIYLAKVMDDFLK